MSLDPTPGGGGPGWQQFTGRIEARFRQRMTRPFWLWPSATADLPTLAINGANEGAITYDDTLNRPTFYNGSAWKPLALTADFREVGARIYHNANQSIADATAAVLSLNTTRRANNITVGADKLTVVEAGWYALAASVAFASNAVGLRFINLKINGTTYIGSQSTSALNGLPTQLGVTTLYYLVATDFVQIEVYQDSGGALNVLASTNYSPELSMVKLGAAL